MFCTECGCELEDGTKQCPRCGHRPGSPPKKKKRRILSVIAVAILLVSMFCLAFVETPDEEENHISRIGNRIVYLTGTDSGYFVMTYEVDEDGNIVINDDGSVTITFTLTESVASRYETFAWYIEDSSGNVLDNTDFSEDNWLELTIELPDGFAQYSIIVGCIGSDNSHSVIPSFGPSRQTLTFYTFDLVFGGTVTESYSWQYDGVDFGVSISFEYSQYYESITGTPYDSGRYPIISYSLISSYLVVDEVTAELESALASEYAEKTGKPTEGQDYAEYLLAFVQICFDYLDDEDTYGYEEFFAYGVETIYNNGGDCEDLAVLLACLYLAAGYDAGVFIVPGHAITAVAVDGFSLSDTDARGVSPFSYVYKGKIYYGCESTLESNEYGIGWISGVYEITSAGTVYVNRVAYTDADYGLFLPAR